MAKTQWPLLSQFSAAQIKALQDALLRKQIREQLYPFSPFYRNMFDKAGIRPELIRGVEDLAKIPLTSKRDLLPSKENPERVKDFLLQPNKELIGKYWPWNKKLPLLFTPKDKRQTKLRREYLPIFVTFTTGRSAAPVSFAYSKHDLDNLSEVGYRLFDIAALPQDSRVVNMFPFAPHLAFWQVTFAGFESGAFVLGTGGGKVLGTDGNIRAIERVRPLTIVGVPGYVYHVLREAKNQGIKFPFVQKIILGAEKITPAMRQKMAELLGEMGAEKTTILGTYGFTEARMAFIECPAPGGESSGYHIYPDLCIFEIIDPQTGEIKPQNEDGELVLTPLAGRSSCVLRYRTGDLVEGGIQWGRCPYCGRTTPRISSKISRVSNQKGLNLTKIKGTLVSLDEIAAILGEFKEIEEWQIELRKKDNDPLELDEIWLWMALEKSVTNMEDIKKRIRDRMISVVEVVPNKIEVIPLNELLQKLGMETEMKEKRFMDLRP